MGVLKLGRPIDIDGGLVTELTYNLEDMTAREKADATKAYKKDGNMMMVQELDSDYHLYLFAAAVKKVSSSIEIDDVLRMNAKDSVKAEALVRDFFFVSSEDTSPTNTSDSALPS